MKHRRCTVGVEQLHGLDLTPLSSSLGGGRMQGACLVKVLTGTTPGPALFNPSTDFSAVSMAQLFPLGDGSPWVYEECRGLLALHSWGLPAQSLERKWLQTPEEHIILLPAVNNCHLCEGNPRTHQPVICTRRVALLSDRRGAGTRAVFLFQATIPFLIMQWNFFVVNSPPCVNRDH